MMLISVKQFKAVKELLSSQILDILLVVGSLFKFLVRLLFGIKVFWGLPVGVSIESLLTPKLTAVLFGDSARLSLMFSKPKLNAVSCLLTGDAFRNPVD